MSGEAKKQSRVVAEGEEEATRLVYRTEYGLRERGRPTGQVVDFGAGVLRAAGASPCRRSGSGA